MPYDPNAGEKHNKVLADEALQDREELRKLLQTEIGRKFVYRIFEDSFIFTTTFVKNSTTFFNEGKRDAALTLFNAVLEIDPHIFAEMCITFRNEENNG